MSKVVFKNFYLVNKLATGLVLKAGYISIKVGGYAKIMESDLEHPDVIDAVNKEWAEVHSSEPDVSSLPKAPTPIIEVDSYRGMTADELKESTDAPKESTSRTESIGRNAEIEKSGEAVSVAIGKTAEEANGVAKKGRKAADKAADAAE
jgi:hypothetical protein